MAVRIYELEETAAPVKVLARTNGSRLRIYDLESEPFVPAAPKPLNGARVRTQIRIFDLEPKPEPRLFTGMPKSKGGPGVGALFGSILVHLLVVVSVNAFCDYMAWLHADDVDW